MRLHLTVLSLAAAAIVAGPACAADAKGEANIRMVKQFLAEIRIAATSEESATHVRAVVEHYMAADYIQHARRVPAGREGFIQVMSQAMKPEPGGYSGKAPPRPNDINFVADGPYVIWVSELARSAAPSDGKKFMFNMFRIERGKFKEHWDSE